MNLNKLKEIISRHRSSFAHSDQGVYINGLANGLIYADSILYGYEPNYIEQKKPLATEIYRERLAELEKLIVVQCSDGNANYSPYMYGMANGMILAKSVMDAGECVYMEKPKAFKENLFPNTGHNNDIPEGVHLYTKASVEEIAVDFERACGGESTPGTFQSWFKPGNYANYIFITPQDDGPILPRSVKHFDYTDKELNEVKFNDSFSLDFCKIWNLTDVDLVTIDEGKFLISMLDDLPADYVGMCVYMNGDGTGKLKMWVAPFVPRSSGAKYRIIATTKDLLFEPFSKFKDVQIRVMVTQDEAKQYSKPAQINVKAVWDVSPNPEIARIGFMEALVDLINRHNFEAPTNTPDFMLAEYLCNCLDNFNVIVSQREQWKAVGATDAQSSPTCDAGGPMQCYQGGDFKPECKCAACANARGENMAGYGEVNRMHQHGVNQEGAAKAAYEKYKPLVEPMNDGNFIIVSSAKKLSALDIEVLRKIEKAGTKGTNLKPQKVCAGNWLVTLGLVESVGKSNATYIINVAGICVLGDIDRAQAKKDGTDMPQAWINEAKEVFKPGAQPGPGENVFHEIANKFTHSLEAMINKTHGMPEELRGPAGVLLNYAIEKLENGIYKGYKPLEILILLAQGIDARNKTAAAAQ